MRVFEILSTMLMTKMPIKIRAIPLPYSPSNNSMALAGKQTIEVPRRGTKDMIAMALPQKIVDSTARIANATPPRIP